MSAPGTEIEFKTVPNLSGVNTLIRKCSKCGTVTDSRTHCYICHSMCCKNCTSFVDKESTFFGYCIYCTCPI